MNNDNKVKTEYWSWGNRELIERIEQLEHEADKTYNGWSNYETWRVNLEILDAYDWGNGDEYNHFDSLQSVADYLKDYVDEIVLMPEEASSQLALDYAQAFLSHVNYYEIAQKIAREYPRLMKGAAIKC